VIIRDGTPRVSKDEFETQTAKLYAKVGKIVVLGEHLCCEAWNDLIDQPWRIASIGRRAWAHEF
jgi:hypothetical protein